MKEVQEFHPPREIRSVMEQIVTGYHPSRIYLYSQRSDLHGETNSFKLCVVMETEEKFQVEQDIYLNIDCDIPYDVLIYTPDEWDDITRDPHSFASKVKQTGVLIYDQT